MTTHSSILSWRTPWTQEPRGLQSTRSLKSETCLSASNRARKKYFFGDLFGKLKYLETVLMELHTKKALLLEDDIIRAKSRNCM